MSLILLPTDTCFWLCSSIEDECSFHDIYRVKWRDAHKMLAFLVQDFHALESFADIEPSHIDFLRSYPYPFSVILAPRHPDKLPSFLPELYHQSIAFRIAECCLDEDIRSLLPYPCFLTSANKSGDKEYYSRDDALQSLGHPMEFFSHYGVDIIDQNPPSDIFCITQQGLEFVRQNYT